MKEAKMAKYGSISDRVCTAPKITLVGAGPGDPELISLKGIKALKTADVVIYDALVDESLLDYAPKHAPRVYVGDPSGDESFSQAVVNRLMVDYAMNFGHLVRLKGGDLFVFGGGYDELNYAASYSIDTSIVPGISSAISVPGLQGIPVTHKGTSEGVWILSGSDAYGNLNPEILKAAESEATVVLLLAFQHLQDIVLLYEALGKGSLPAAVIQSGSMKNEKIALGTVSSINAQVEDMQLLNDGPILLVFGEAVALHPSFHPLVQVLGSHCLRD